MLKVLNFFCLYANLLQSNKTKTISCESLACYFTVPIPFLSLTKKMTISFNIPILKGRYMHYKVQFQIRDSKNTKSVASDKRRMQIIF